MRCSATTFWHPWHLWISNECLMSQLMLIVTPRSWNGLSIEQNECGLWLWCVWIIEGIIHSPGSRWVITQRTHNVVLMPGFPKPCVPVAYASPVMAHEKQTQCFRFSLGVFYKSLFGCMYFKASYKAFLLSLSGTERLPQIFMRNFFKTFPSKRGGDGGLWYCTVSPFYPQ